MASISIHVDGDVKFEKATEFHGCISIDVKKDIDTGDGKTYTYSRDHLSLHGDKDSIRAFAQGIIDSLHTPLELIAAAKAEG